MAHAPRRTLSMVLAAIVAVAGLSATDAVAAPCGTAGPDWAAGGPFPTTTDRPDARHTVFRPVVLGAGGCTRNPVILWGNGTGGHPRTYKALLTHLASYGFVVVAANTPMAGSGKQMLAGLDALTRLDGTAGSPYAGRVDLGHVGATGHSQGGKGAIAAAADPRVTTVAPLEPGPGDVTKLHSPILLLGGSADIIISPRLVLTPRFDKISGVVAEYGILKGATHFTPVGDGGGFAGPLTAWMRFQLMGDQSARSLFFGPACGLCTSADWTRFSRNSLAQQVP